MFYRTHNCSSLSLENVGLTVKLSGWVHSKRDHGGVLFLDLRDHYGIIQLKVDVASKDFSLLERISLESVISVEGIVQDRPKETVNPSVATGEIEVCVEKVQILSEAITPPFPINNRNIECSDEVRLKYRYLDLRRIDLHERIVFRSAVVDSLRRAMQQRKFLEISTPILTASSPEGARDFVIPSRLHEGRFYALPQSPQQFKQLLMVAGFDRYFQIAPCFRDEDARADRSPGEFYQMDFEMSFVTADEVRDMLEGILFSVFKEFAGSSIVTAPPFPVLTYQESLSQYGTDKPDLRNPLRILDLTAYFEHSEFRVFAEKIKNSQAVVKALVVPKLEGLPRSFFDTLNTWAKDQGKGGLAYMRDVRSDSPTGPVAKYFSEEQKSKIQELVHALNGDSLLFICAPEAEALAFSGVVRSKVGEDLDLIEKNAFRFCWVKDFPMYERDPLSGKIIFSHNPFSMPLGGIEALNQEDPLKIIADQFDIVCNGCELSSGAIRNHTVEGLYKAFAIAGYSREEVMQRFGGMITAFSYGAPPHGGSAPGVDRMVMLLSAQKNIREVIPFPLNQSGQDLMMGAPSYLSPDVLKELHIRKK